MYCSGCCGSIFCQVIGRNRAKLFYDVQVLCHLFAAVSYRTQPFLTIIFRCQLETLLVRDCRILTAGFITLVEEFGDSLLDNLSGLVRFHLLLAENEHVEQVYSWIGRSRNEILRLFDFLRKTHKVVIQASI